MEEKLEVRIQSVLHRHSDLKDNQPSVLLEVGKPIPRFYEHGRKRGLVVKSIEGNNALTCTLENGDIIMIGENSIEDIKTDAPDSA